MKKQHIAYVGTTLHREPQRTNLVPVINNETTPSYTYLQCNVILYEGMTNSEKLSVHVKHVLKIQMLLGLTTGRKI